ncbi:MAG: helix-turn-helix transcriptional regulator [Candidatus Binatia bacterium]
MVKNATKQQSATVGVISADPDALLLENQAAAFLGFSPRALQSWRQRGGGPAFVRVSARAIRYRKKDLIAWAESKLQTNTAA